MSNHVITRSLLALLFLGALLLPLWAQAEEADQPKAQAAPAQPNTPAPVPALTPEDAALRAIQEEGQLQVAAVVEQMTGLKPGPALLELQRRVEQIKRDTTVRFLSARANFSRARGDEASALEAEKVIDQILHPTPPPAETSPQPREKSADPKGGSR